MAPARSKVVMCIAALVGIAPAAAQTPPPAAPAETRGGAPGALPYGPALRPPSPATPAEAALREPRPPREPVAARGLELGSFILAPEISFTRRHDDNIYATRIDEKSDWVSVISPAVSLKSRWERHRLDFWAGADRDEYDRFDSENVTDTWLEAQGRYDFSADANVYAGVGASRNHEDRSSPDRPVAAAEPVIFRERKGHLGTLQQWGPLSVRVGATYEHLDFDDVKTNDGATLDMDDRDRAHTAFGGRVGYRLSPRLTPFVQASAERRRYDTTPDGGGFDRDSDGYRAAVGTRLDFGAVRGEAYVGALRQDYRDPRLADVSGADFGADLAWQVSPPTKLTAWLERSVEETTIVGASASLDTSAGVRVEHRVGDALIFNARAARIRSAFQGPDLLADGLHRTDDTYEAGFGVKYDLGRYVYLAADYSYVKRNSNFADANYVRNTVFFSVGTQFLPAPAPLAAADGGWLEAAGDENAAAPGVGGAYVGLKVGASTLLTELDGPRGERQTVANEFGDTAATAGLFAGYGLTWRAWYLGVELDSDDGADRWHHDTLPPERGFSAARDEAAALALRLGRVLDSGALLYVRAGRARAEFSSRYARQDEAAEEGGFRQYGTLAGVGVEVPVSAHAFLRLDYAHTRYDAYELGGDRFANSESAFNAGLGWRFGAREAAPVRPARHDGFYVGAQVGELAATADRHSDQVSGQAARASTLRVQQAASDLVYGLVAGYGRVFGRHWYLGGELELEPGRVDWQQERGPGDNGRDIRVERKDARGFAVRFGYVLASGPLLWVRAGKVRTDYRVQYEKGQPDKYLDFESARDGVRIGAGADVPLGPDVFLRLDYSITDYDTIAFTTPHGNADTVRFDPRDAVFKLGVGVRF